MAKSYQKTIVDGISFDSTTEAEFYEKLKVAKKQNKIKDFEISPKYLLQESFTNWRGGKESEINHLPDYLITLLDDTKIVVDTKGSSMHETDAKLKRKIWMYNNQEIPYYYASLCPKYIGGQWVETSPNADFLKKLKNCYDKLYPNVNKRLGNTPKLNVSDWNRYFEYHDVAGLFYIMDKMYTKKELEKRNTTQSFPK